MINWKALIEEEELIEKDDTFKLNDCDWRNEASFSLCELYYMQYRTQRSCNFLQRIDLRSGSDFNRFMESHLSPLSKYNLWEALFPNKKSASSAGAIDEALRLLADSKLVDRVFSRDIITANRIISNIRKKRAKFLDNL